MGGLGKSVTVLAGLIIVLMVMYAIIMPWNMRVKFMESCSDAGFQYYECVMLWERRDKPAVVYPTE